mmetsp:Transcript_10054/g.24019  ORF Transcript_10054/g.24019 Transcript_10054/m.24019 type:complete len:294 (-) Transcript_10054:128-1009(-)
MAPVLLGLLMVAVPEHHWYDGFAAADAAADAARAGRSNAVMQPRLGAGSVDARAAIVDNNAYGGQPKVGGKGCGSYLMISMQRSGTTTICTDINDIQGQSKQRRGEATNSSKGDFVCQYELLNTGELQSGHRFLEHTNHTSEWAEKYPRELVRQAAHQAKAGGACVWGFKIFDGQIAAVDKIVDRFDKCIIYRRENTTAQYLSWKTAVETDCWETSPQEQAANPACAEKVTQLGDDWPEFQEGVRAWYNVSETACRNAGKPVVFVSMEEYLAPKWQTYTQEVDVLMRAKVKLP